MTTTKTKNLRDATLVVEDKAIKLKLLADELIARGYKLRYGDDSEQTIDAGAVLASLDAEKVQLQSEIDLDELSYALDAIKEPVFIHDDAFCLVKINRAYTQCTDLPPEEIIGKRYWEVFPLGDGPLAGSAERVAKAGGPPEEFPITLDDGRTFYSKGFAVTDQHGRYRFSVHILEDITESKASEENAAISEDIMRAVASSAHDAIIVAGNDGKILFWNAAAEQIFGHRQDDAIGQDMHALIIPERFHKDANEGFAVFKKTGQGPLINKTLETQGLRKNGEEFPVELSISAFQLKGLWHAVGIVRDISERKQAEGALRNSEQRLRELVENEADGVLVLDMDDATIKFVNPAAEVMFDRAAQEMLGKPFGFPVPVDKPAEMNIFRPDAKLLVAEMRVGQTEWESDPAHVVTLRDITKRKQTEASLERSNRMLRTRSAINQALIHATDEQQLLNEICQIIVKTGNYRMVWVGYLKENDEQRLVPVAKAGHVGDYLELLPSTCFVPTQVGACPSALCILTGSTAVANDIQTNPQYATWNKLAGTHGFGSSIALPLDLGMSGNGVINIYTAEANVFHDEDTALLTELAEDLAFGIQIIRLRLDHEQSSEKLQNALVQTIQAIANIVEQRDPYTAGHQRRVAELSVAIATDMGLDEEQIKGIRMGAIIHNIGNIYIPIEILNRPGKLNDDEFAYIKGHSEIGYNIIKGVEFPWPVNQMIRQHHERMDGSGYPDGLEGDAILLEARILAVADVVEAMVSHRPYRPALGIDAALKEIKKNRSRFYDEEVVDSCIKLFENKILSQKD